MVKPEVFKDHFPTVRVPSPKSRYVKKCCEYISSQIGGKNQNYFMYMWNLGSNGVSINEKNGIKKSLATAPLSYYSF